LSLEYYGPLADLPIAVREPWTDDTQTDPWIVAIQSSDLWDLLSPDLQAAILDSKGKYFVINGNHRLAGAVALKNGAHENFEWECMVYKSDMPYKAAVAMSRLLTQAEGLIDTAPPLSELLRHCQTAFPNAKAVKGKNSKEFKVNATTLDVALKADGVTTSEHLRELYLALVVGKPGTLDVMSALEGVAVRKLRDSLGINETHRTKTLSAFVLNSLKQMRTARPGLTIQETQFAAVAGAWLHRVRIGSSVTPSCVKQALTDATTGSNQVSDMATVGRCLEDLRGEARELTGSSKGAEILTFISEKIPLMWFYACSGTPSDRAELSKLVDAYNELGLATGTQRINGFLSPAEREKQRKAQEEKLAQEEAEKAETARQKAEEQAEAEAAKQATEAAKQAEMDQKAARDMGDKNAQPARGNTEDENPERFELSYVEGAEEQPLEDPVAHPSREAEQRKVDATAQSTKPNAGAEDAEEKATPKKATPTHTHTHTHIHTHTHTHRREQTHTPPRADTHTAESELISERTD
jgi:hypothetical protein